MSTSEDDKGKFWRKMTSVIAQGLSQGLAREALLIIVREVWRQGPWL